jgi:hypothetical protein
VRTLPTTTPAVRPTLESSADCAADGKQRELLKVMPLMRQRHERVRLSAVVFAGQLL